LASISSDSMRAFIPLAAEIRSGSILNAAIPRRAILAGDDAIAAPFR